MRKRRFDIGAILCLTILLLLTFCLLIYNEIHKEPEIFIAATTCMLNNVSIQDTPVPPEDLIAEPKEEERPTLHCFSQKEVELVARVIATEARGECYEGQCAVAQVIFDRLNQVDRLYGENLEAVIYRPNQFASPSNVDLSKYPSTLQAAKAVFNDGYRVFEEEVKYFFNPNTANARLVASLRKNIYVGTIGHHEFRGGK